MVAVTFAVTLELLPLLSVYLVIGCITARRSAGRAAISVLATGLVAQVEVGLFPVAEVVLSEPYPEGALLVEPKMSYRISQAAQPP